MDEKKQCDNTPGRFCWNELLTTDEASAKKFYSALFGWSTEPFEGGNDYSLIKKGKDCLGGGIMKTPKPGMPSHWMPYVSVEDVDAATSQTKQLGGKVIMGPFDVPMVGRIAVLADPTGANIGVIKFDKNAMEKDA